MDHLGTPSIEIPTPRRIYFSRIRRMPARVENGGRWLGKLDDLVVRFDGADACIVGLRLGSDRTGPDQFIPWNRVVEVFGVGVIVEPPDGDRYPPFQPHSGWIEAGRHLIGSKLGASENHKAGTVNDLVFEIQGVGWCLVAVDTGDRGLLRRWGLGKMARFVEEKLIPWEDARVCCAKDICPGR